MTQQRISDYRLLRFVNGSNIDDDDAVNLALDLTDARALLVQKNAEIAALKILDALIDQPAPPAPEPDTHLHDRIIALRALCAKLVGALTRAADRIEQMYIEPSSAASDEGLQYYRDALKAAEEMGVKPREEG